ncbi:hypothetical protein K0M31_010496, partial [Melipona bicolor]
MHEGWFGRADNSGGGGGSCQPEEEKFGNPEELRAAIVFKMVASLLGPARRKRYITLYGAVSPINVMGHLRHNALNRKLTSIS